MRLLPCLTLLFAAALPAQRVFVLGAPSNLVLNLANTLIVPDPAAGNAFFALMPLSTVQTPGNGFARFDSGLEMNMTFGVGTWRRCTMTATDWAYITDTACAHTPGVGYSAPISLLTTTYDYGAYSGQIGVPYAPFANSTRFPQNFQSFVAGLGTFSFDREYWQLRTRAVGA
jgi:hypothetical protein